MKAIIRDAHEGYLTDIVRMGEEFFNESGFAAVTTWDDETFLRTAVMLMIGDDGLLLAAEEGGRVIGMAGGVIFPFFMNANQRIAQELFWWVSPDYRAGIGNVLLEQLEAEASRRGADVFLTANIAGERDGAFKRLYMQRGYKPSENMFMKVLN